MTRFFHAAILLLALAIPPTVAHSPPGSPKNFCEDPSEWSVHEYTVPAAGLPYLVAEGNQVEDCNGDSINGDDDGHAEFTTGAALLAVVTGDFTSTGSFVCVGEVGHHGSFGDPILVIDALLGTAAPFTVSADTVDLFPSDGDNCGDFITDVSIDCVGECRPTFLTGLDGSYHVSVGTAAGATVGAVGHICSPACTPPERSSECSDGFDNDGDGRYDYPFDPECVDGQDDSEGA